MSSSCPTGSAHPDELAERLATEGRRLSGRLRGLSAARLSENVTPSEPSVRGGTRAGLGRTAAKLFADLSAGVEARGSASPPPWRPVPTLHDFAVGDQISVTCADAVAAVGALADTRAGAAEPVWTQEGRRTAAEAVGTVLAQLREIRLAID